MKKTIAIITFLIVALSAFAQQFPLVKGDTTQIPEVSIYWNHAQYTLRADTSLSAYPSVLMPPSGYTIDGSTSYTWNRGEKGSTMTLVTDTIAGDVAIIEIRELLSKSSMFRYVVGSEVNTNSTARTGAITPVNTTLGAVTVTPPPSPQAGDWFGVADSRATAASNNITVDTSGDKLNAASADYIISAAGATEFFIYINSTIGWIRI